MMTAAQDPSPWAAYHARMRRSLSLLLMLVLVLRGLAGTAMAAGVLPPAAAHGGMHSGQPAFSAPAPPAHHHASSHARAEAAHPHGHHGGADAEAMGRPTCEGSGIGGTCTDEHHAATCSACEICHAAMLNVPSVHIPGHRPPGALRVLAAAPFESAAPARAIKPPIA